MRGLIGAVCAALALVACTNNGSDNAAKPPHASRATTSTTRQAPAPTPSITPATPRELKVDRDIEQYKSWTLRAYVDSTTTPERFCIELTLRWTGDVATRTACNLHFGLDLFEGPMFDVAGAYFGVVANDATRVRLNDKQDRVVDVGPTYFEGYPFKGFVAIVPSGYRMDKAASYNAASTLLRTAELRTP
jgi:hypothetical protein